MTHDSMKEAAKWISYKNPVVTNSVQGFNSMVSILHIIVVHFYSGTLKFNNKYNLKDLI
jgi:hypothetical protein